MVGLPWSVTYKSSVSEHIKSGLIKQPSKCSKKEKETYRQAIYVLQSLII